MAAAKSRACAPLSYILGFSSFSLLRVPSCVGRGTLCSLGPIALHRSATTVKRISFRYPSGLTSVFDLPTNVHDAPTSEGGKRSDSYHPKELRSGAASVGSITRAEAATLGPHSAKGCLYHRAQLTLSLQTYPAATKFHLNFQSGGFHCHHQKPLFENLAWPLVPKSPAGSFLSAACD
jgi:hypothetical protein